MKKRVAVYADRLPHVLRVIRALPLFAFHRQDWDVLRPYVVRLASFQALKGTPKSTLLHLHLLTPFRPLLLMSHRHAIDAE